MSIGNRIYAELRGDRAIWTIVIILAIISILVVYSATSTIAYQKADGNTESYLMKHLIFVFGGLFLSYIFYTMHYMNYSKAAPVLMLIAIPLLVYTMAYGVEINNARRWIHIPLLNMNIQTSDFAKLALVVYVARAISSKQEYIDDFNSAFLPIIVPILIICFLIAPSDLSSALLLFSVCMLMMFIGRVNVKYILLLLILGVIIFALLIALGEVFPELVRTATWVERLKSFSDGSDGGHQVQQAKIAIADGQWFGVGPGNSVQRNFLFSPFSDFIYAIICEEYGLFGGFVVLGLYIFFFFRCVKMITRSPKAFGAMLVLGLGLLITMQALANIAVSVDLVPVTGLTLPLISLGGTSYVFSCLAVGMILSVSRYIEKAA